MISRAPEPIRGFLFAFVRRVVHNAPCSAYSVGMIRLPLTFAGALLATALIAGVAVAQSGNGTAQVTARLIADAVRAEPGQTLRVAVQLDMADGWHVYWQNPGDAGMAVEVKWQLPEGWTAGELHWPLPRRFDEAGEITSFGYSGRVLLLADIHVPPTAPMGEQVTIGATVQWLACKELCVPGEAVLSLPLFIGSLEASDEAELIKQWRGHLPATQKPEAFRIVQASVDSDDKATIHLAWDKPGITAVRAFPHRAAGLIVQAPQVQMHETAAEVSFDIRPINADERPQSMRVLIVYEEAGERKGFAIDLPLAAGD